MLYRCLLILLGLNQTLVLAFLPELSNLLGFSQSEKDLGLVTLILNLNLITYWFGVKFWGNRLSQLGLWTSTRIAVGGFLAANVLFWLSLFASEQTSLLVVGASRLLLGVFSSAFVILAHCHLSVVNKTNLGQLAKTSGAITIGRLLGPSLALLPLATNWLMFSPILLVLPALLYCLSTTPPWSSAKQQQTPNHAITSSKSWHFKSILSLAVLTTSLVSIVQYYILPQLFNFGYQGEQASKVYASLLLYLSLALIVYQFFLLPVISRYARLIPGMFLLFLGSGAILLSLSVATWWLLLLALALLAFAISGLPSWYSQQAYQANSSLSFRAKRSAYLARAHTAGYLLGTAVASISLLLSIPLLTPIWLFSLAMIGLIVHLNRQDQLQATLT